MYQYKMHGANNSFEKDEKIEITFWRKFVYI